MDKQGADSLKRYRGQPAPECSHCSTRLTAIYEQASVRAYCPRCARQGPSKADFAAACEAWYSKHGRRQ